MRTRPNNEDVEYCYGDDDVTENYNEPGRHDGLWSIAEIVPSDGYSATANLSDGKQTRCWWPAMWLFRPEKTR